MQRKGFTLTEIMIVIGILIVLLLVVIYTLNPHKVINEGRDGNRAGGISTLDKAISLYYSNALSNPTTLFMGTSSVIYVSIPDLTATTTAGTNCASLGLPSVPGMTYHCAASSTYLDVNGTGWVPINFTTYPGGSPIASLPADPLNVTSSRQYYIYVTNGTRYEIRAIPQSPSDSNDSADFEKGNDAALLSNF